jgi:hypothetical protein
MAGFGGDFFYFFGLTERRSGSKSGMSFYSEEDDSWQRLECAHVFSAQESVFGIEN